MGQYDTAFYLKINVDLCDLYFIAQWFSLISPTISLSYIRLTSQVYVDWWGLFYLWSSHFASCLEDYLLQKSYTWDNRSVLLRDWPCKLHVGQWSIFHGPLILPYIIVIDLKIFYNLEMAPAGGIRYPLGTCSSWVCTCMFKKVTCSLQPEIKIFVFSRQKIIPRFVDQKYLRAMDSH